MSNARLDHVTWCESEITRLEKENAELRAKLDAWERQRPVAFIYQATTEAYLAFDDLRNPMITIPDEDVIPLFTKPKEA